MRKFKLKKNLTAFDYLLKSKDEIIEIDNIYLFENDGISLTLSIEDILNKPEMFEEIIDIKTTIQEVNDIDEIKDYRIQLDVKTSKRKLMEIEKVMKDSIMNII
jgi:hypothetical protein